MRKNESSLFESRLIVLAFALLSLSFLNVSSQGVWTQKANFPGTPRGDAFYFSIGNMGYVGAGADSNTNVLSDFWQYDALNNSWTQKASFAGAARWQGVAFSIGSKGYVGVGSGLGWYNDFWEYDPATDTWAQKASLPADARTAAVGFAIGDKGYIGTGYGCSPIPCININHNDFWEYNPLTDSWTQKATIPTNGRAFGFGLSIGSKGYIGGGHDNFGNTFNDFWEYNPATDIWIQKANYGGGQRSDADGAHFTIENYGYVGTGLYPSASSTFNDFWKYDPSTDSWSQIPNLPAQSRIGAVGFSLNNKGYIGTGYWVTNVPHALNDLWSFTDTTLIDSIAPPDTLIIPNVFTPNNDGVNDLFIPLKNIGMTINQISIFNRWGNLIHEEGSPNILWDGKIKNKNAANDVYYWVIEYRNSKGIKNVMTGFLELIK